MARRGRGQALPRHADPGPHGQLLRLRQDRALPISDVFSHCNSVNACHMANIAMLLGRRSRGTEKKEFIGDSEANQLMRRPQREPYAIKV